MPSAGGVTAAQAERDDAGNLDLLAALCPPGTGRDFLGHVLRDLHAGDMQVPPRVEQRPQPSKSHLHPRGDGAKQCRNSPKPSVVPSHAMPHDVQQGKH